MSEICENGNDFVIRNGVLKKYKGTGKNVVFPEDVIKIGTSAFNRCNSLVTITIPKGVTKIGIEAFSYCESLESVSIPASVMKIDMRAFRGCSVLEKIHYCGTKKQWKDVKKGRGWRWNSLIEFVECTDGKVELRPFSIKNEVLKKYFGVAPSVSIPDYVTKIGKYAFSMCDPLVSVTIPEGVTKIGKFAFTQCKSLASVCIPKGVTKIGEGAFSFCYSLAAVSLPDSVLEIDNGAFAYCKFESISIPAGIKRIGSKAFAGSDSPKRIHFCGTKEQWKAVEKGENMGYFVVDYCGDV